MPKKSKKSKDKSSADAAPEEEEDFPVRRKGGKMRIWCLCWLYRKSPSISGLFEDFDISFAFESLQEVDFKSEKWLNLQVAASPPISLNDSPSHCCRPYTKIITNDNRRFLRHFHRNHLHLHHHLHHHLHLHLHHHRFIFTCCAQRFASSCGASLTFKSRSALRRGFIPSWTR